MPLGAGRVDPDGQLAVAVLTRPRGRARRLARRGLGVGSDGVLEVEDERVDRQALGLLQRPLVGRRQVEHRAARPEVGAHASTSMASYAAFSSGSIAGELLGEPHHHQALLEGRVVLHLAVEHHRAGAVAHRGDDAPRVRDVLDARGEDPPGDVDLLGVQAPGADAAEQERVAELVLARDGVGDVAEGAVVGVDPVHRARVDHPRDRVVPEVLLVRRPVGRLDAVAVLHRIRAHEVARVPAADPRGLHPPVGGQVGRAEGEALHARARAADLLDVGDAAGGLEDRVHQQRPVEPGLRLELGEQPVDVPDVLGALDLRHHDHVEPVADLGDEGGQVVEDPGAVEGVDAGPQLGGAAASPETVCRLGDLDQPRAGGLLAVGLDGVLEVAEQHVDGADELGHLGRHLLVARVEEVDRPARPGRDLAQRLGGADGERTEEVLGGSHAAERTAHATHLGMTCSTRRR